MQRTCLGFLYESVETAAIQVSPARLPQQYIIHDLTGTSPLPPFTHKNRKIKA
jgi:hypothetical protein